MGLFKNIQDLIFQVTTHDHYATYDDELAARTNELSTNSLNNGSNTSISMLDNSSSTSLANHSNRSSMTGNNNTTNNNNNTNPVNYRPGLRSNQIHNSVGNINNNSSGRPSNDVPLQDYINGQPPLPSIASIWERIDDWCENEFPELGDDIEDGATTNDLNAFERDLKIHLPLDIRESYQIHDGEVQMGKKRGLIYSNPLMDLESIASETMVWRKAALKVQNTINNYKQNELMNNTTNHSQDIKDPNLGSSSSSSATASADIPLKLPPNHPIARFIHNQRSIPDGAIQEVYAHDNWIPLVKDNVGNNIAVDLAPGQRGKWGQIILFGRDYDTKYVIANSWAEFLLNLVEDLEAGKFIIDEIDEDLNFQENGRTFNYFDVLKHRSYALAKSNNRLPRLPERQQQRSQNQQQQQQRAASSTTTPVATASSSSTPASTLSAATIQQGSADKKGLLPRETLISPILKQSSTIESHPANSLKQHSKSASKASNNFVLEDEDEEDEDDKVVIEPKEESKEEAKEEPEKEEEVEVVESKEESKEELKEEPKEEPKEEDENLKEEVEVEAEEPKEEVKEESESKVGSEEVEELKEKIAAL